MKKFLQHIAYFSIAILAVLTLVDGVVTFQYHRKDTRKYAVWNDIKHKDLNADVLIMGSSRAWCMYSPVILDSVLGTNSYNLGIDGSSFDRQLARYDIYRHYQKAKPAYIIQNVEFSSLDKTIGYEREQFMPYMMYPYFRERIGKVEPFTCGELYIPMYRYYVNSFYEDYTNYDYSIKKGYYGNDRSWDGTKFDDIASYEANVDSLTLKLFEDFLANSKQEGITVILVIAPYYKGIEKKVQNLQEVHQIYYDLASQHDLPLLDYSKYSLSQDTEYFYNATHLNRKGAELFSVQLAHDLDSIVFKHVR